VCICEADLAVCGCRPVRPRVWVAYYFAGGEQLCGLSSCCGRVES
jgi:hypothetical protein